jgi:hypothetical protein
LVGRNSKFGIPLQLIVDNNPFNSFDCQEFASKCDFSIVTSSSPQNASKKSKDSEKRCLKDDAIDNCECERLRREKFVSLREEYQQQHVEHTMITAQESRRRSRAIRRPFLDM